MHTIQFCTVNVYVYIYIYTRWNRKEWGMNERGAAEFAWLLIVNVEPLATYSLLLFLLLACVRVFKSARFCAHCQKVKTSSTLVARHRHLSARSTVIYACAFRFRGCILCQVIRVDTNDSNMYVCTKKKSEK